MSARPSVVSVAGPLRAAPLFSIGNIEALKWCAVAFMFVEHWQTLVLQGPGGFSWEVGRMAFPLFAFCFAYAVSGDVLLTVTRCYRSAFRLAAFAVLVQVFVIAARGALPLNVLFTFFCASAWVAAEDESIIRKWFVRAMAIGIAFYSEFWWPGLALVVGFIRLCESPGRLSGYLWSFGAWCVIAALDGTPASVVAFGVAGVVLAFDISVRRIPHVFSLLYGLQFPLAMIFRGL